MSSSRAALDWRSCGFQGTCEGMITEPLSACWEDGTRSRGRVFRENASDGSRERRVR